jgi:hypothetical protein
MSARAPTARACGEHCGRSVQMQSNKFLQIDTMLTFCIQVVIEHERIHQFHTSAATRHTGDRPQPTRGRYQDAHDALSHVAMNRSHRRGRGLPVASLRRKESHLAIRLL